MSKQIKHAKRLRAGFTVIEVLLAITIIIIGTGGVFALTARTVAVASANNNKLVASYLAQEGVEIVRNIRDTNFLKIREGVALSWDEGIILPGSVCATSPFCQADYSQNSLSVAAGGPLFRDGVTNLYNHTAGTPTIFIREIKTVAVGTDKIEVEVKVLWSERGDGREVQAVTEIYNWLIL